jgi:Ca2+-binding EF-hand superfamily protein
MHAHGAPDEIGAARRRRRSDMSNLSALGSQGYNPYALQQFAQSLFNQIDTSGSGSISQSALEQAVAGAGGTTQAADALYSELNPNGSGGITEQQFAQALIGPLIGPSYSDQVQAQLIGYQAQGWPGGSSHGPVAALAQSLVNQIDPSGSGSFTQSQLEQAVTAAGGTTQAADALFSQLDPNGTGSVTEQQLAQLLSQSVPHGGHHHHHHGGAVGASDGNSAGGALTALFNADGEDEPGTSPTQVAQNIFSAIDTTGSGAITQTQLEQAVTAAGGATQGADALFAALDPGNTGSVSEQQFLAALQPPSATGNTASDALVALVDPASSSPAGTNTSTGTTAVGAGAASDSGNTAQDALNALVTAGGSGDGSGTAQASAQIAAAFAQALALYQAQLNQQLGAGLGPFASQITLA